MAGNRLVGKVFAATEQEDRIRIHYYLIATDIASNPI